MKKFERLRKALEDETRDLIMKCKHYGIFKGVTNQMLDFLIEEKILVKVTEKEKEEVLCKTSNFNN